MNAFSRRYVINHHVLRRRVIRGGKNWVMSMRRQYYSYRTAFLRNRSHWLHRHRYYVFRRYWHQVWRKYQARLRHLRLLAIRRRNAARRAANARRRAIYNKFVSRYAINANTIRQQLLRRGRSFYVSVQAYQRSLYRVYIRYRRDWLYRSRYTHYTRYWQMVHRQWHAIKR